MRDFDPGTYYVQDHGVHQDIGETATRFLVHPAVFCLARQHKGHSTTKKGCCQPVGGVHFLDSIMLDDVYIDTAL